MSIKIDSFATEVTKSLQDWTQDVQFSVVEATDQKANKLIELLQSTSPKNTGTYAKEWKSKVETNNFSFYRRKVYNRKKYRITHLLEHGYVNRKGKRVGQKVHIKPAREQIEQEFETAIINAIKESQKGGGGYRPAIRNK